MTSSRLFLILFALLGGASALLGESPGRAVPPVALIFDTDMGNDVDDALALGLIHALESRGQCRLIGVTLTNPEPLAASYIAAVDAFYGRPDIPIGVTPDAPRVSRSRYVQLAAEKDARGQLRYPSHFDVSQAPTSVSLLRRLLAAAPDHGIVLVQTGFSTNLARLLDTPADAVSPLGGRELVARKVRLLSAMAGAFQTVNHDNHYLEYNVRNDIPSAVRLASQWPTPIVWSGWEIGGAILFPADSIDHDFAYVPHHPVEEAYQLYRATPHERPTWDVTSACYAIFPDRGYFALSPPGRVTIGPDGFTRFSPQKNGRDRYLIVTDVQAATLRGLFAALVSQPPGNAASLPPPP